MNGSKVTHRLNGFPKLAKLLGWITVAIFLFPMNGKQVSAASLWYVKPGGSDGNDCLSKLTPCLTINGAIAKAASGDTIYVAEGIYTNTGATVVQLNKNVSISGGWGVYFTSQDSISVIDGQDARRGIIIADGVITSIEKVKIIHGVGDSSGGGGGIMIGSNATVTIADSLIEDIQSYGAIDASYANLTVIRTMIRNSNDQGILNYLGTLNLVSSTISDNLFGVISNGEAFIENSTISGNTLGGVGIDCTGAISISNSTITGNGEFGLRTYWCNSAVLKNTILAGNTGISNPDCNGPIQSGGYNIIGNTEGCDFTPTTGDQININANLGPLQDNGGSTSTHALLPGSLAINAGNPSGCAGSTGPLTTDQRGASRWGFCDIGAYEFGGTIVSLSASANPSVLGQPVIFTAHIVEGETGTPTGTVAFAYEGGNLGSGPLDMTGTASLSVSALTLGNHTITATYSGDSNFSGNVSPGLNLKVGYSTEISITAVNPEPSVVGQPIDVNFRVTSTQETPTGMVIVVSDVGGYTCYTALSNGLGSCLIIPTETGPINLTATYVGDANFNPSKTITLHIVDKANTTATITANAPDPSNPGQPITVGFSVAVASPGAGTPTGSVTITASDGLETCQGILINGSGNCQIRLNTPGQRFLTASYEGDNRFNSTVSGNQLHHVNYICYLPLSLTPCSPLYSDDFSNPASGWPIADTGNVRYEYLNGEYRLLVRSKNYGAGVRPGLQVSDYAVDVDVRNQNNVSGSYGIVIGLAQDWSTFYTVEIYPDGWFGIYRYDPTSLVTLAEAFSPAINPGSGVNHLKIVRNGASIDAFANGQPLASVNDGTYTGSLFMG